MQWFYNFNYIDGLENRNYIGFALRQMKNIEENRTELLKHLKIADFDIEAVNVEEEDVTQDFIKNAPFSEEVKQKVLAGSKGIASIQILTQHKRFNAENQEVEPVFFKLDEDESQGTKKFVALSAPILDTLKHGRVLLIDELEASLHPILTEYFIKLFHNKELNKNNAQLIFTTHNTHLLSVPKLFERDQIWFTEKNQYGATELYSLLEFRKNNQGVDVRASENLEKSYLQGRFGAVPYIGE
jgi:AAA15 family ATPase/GTPase